MAGTHLDIGEFLTLAMPLLPRVNQGLICHILGAILGAIFEVSTKSVPETMGSQIGLSQ